MIASGHSWQDIQEYDIDQIKLFYDCSQQLEAKRRAATIVDLRLAAWGKGNDVQDFVKKLNNNT